MNVYSQARKNIANGAVWPCEPKALTRKDTQDVTTKMLQGWGAWREIISAYWFLPALFLFLI